MDNMEGESRKLEKSEGVEHARRAIAKARDRYIEALLKFNTSGKYGNRILIRYRPNEPNYHVLVYETLTTWRLLVADEYLSDEVRETWAHELAQVPIPKALLGTEEMAEIDLYDHSNSDYGAPQNPHDFQVTINDLEPKEFSIGLGNITWFDDKYLDVRILGRHSFDGRDVDTRKFRIVPPMYLLKKAGRKLNSLYAQLGEGIQPAQQKQEAYAKYEWIEDKLES